MRKILVADANETSRMDLGRILASSGHDVILAWSVEEALNIFKEKRNRILMVFLDMDAKTGNVEFFLEEVFKISTKGVPVIICSSAGELTLEENARLAKAIAIVDRPYPSRLITTIANAFCHTSFQNTFQVPN